MASQTDIVNFAFLDIGEKTISDISDDSPRSTEASTVYNQQLDEALAMGPEKGWKFAQEEAEISADATAPTNTKFANRFKLPSNHIRTVDVSVGGVSLTDWVRKGQYIHTNQEDTTIVLDYVKRETITGNFPPHFVTVLAAKIAIKLGFRRVQKKQIARALMEEFNLVTLPKAIALDEQEDYLREVSSSWVDIGNNTSTLE
jgi:hypothetical protein